MDCLEGMLDIPDGSVDLIVCDPPYGTINGLGRNTDLLKEDGYAWDVVIPTADLFAQFFRVLRNNGTMVLFSAEPYTSHLRTFSQPCMEFTYPLIWLKRSTGNPLKAKIAPLSFFEDVSVWRKRVDVTSYVFKKGHRVRVEIAGSNSPHYEKAPDPAATRLVRGASHLVLPTIPAGD
jgi:site-specific DNA-methyltransferase (adenine-specific)